MTVHVPPEWSMWLWDADENPRSLKLSGGAFTSQDAQSGLHLNRIFPSPTLRLLFLFRLFLFQSLLKKEWEGVNELYLH